MSYGAGTMARKEQGETGEARRGAMVAVVTVVPVVVAVDAVGWVAVVTVGRPPKAATVCREKPLKERWNERKYLSSAVSGLADKRSR